MSKHEEVENFIAAVVKGSAKFLVEEKTFCFDVKFSVGEIVYRLSLAQQERENDYLKDN